MSAPRLRLIFGPRKERIIRHHVLPRRKKFSPQYSADLPIPLSQIQPDRWTQAQYYTGGEETTHDSWMNRSDRLPDMWTGKTTFVVTGERERGRQEQKAKIN